MTSVKPGPDALRDAGAKRTKRSAALARKWNDAVSALVTAAGGRLVDEYELEDSVYRRHEITGAYGTATITPCGNWLAVCFDEPARAVAFLTSRHVSTYGFNTYSGKWNHNYFGADFVDALSVAGDVVKLLGTI